MLQYPIPKAFVTTAAVSSIAGGILLIAGFALHPAGEDATFGTDPLWVPAHSLLWAAYTVSLIGWIGAYIVQASKAGGLGVVAIVVAILGTSLASWIFSSDVTYVPVIAAEDPGLFKRIFSTGHLVTGVVSVLFWVLGNVLFGASIVRTKVFPKWAGILLALGSLLIPVVYLTGLPVKAIAIAALAVGASQVWLGWSLLSMVRSSTLEPQS